MSRRGSWGHGRVALRGICTILLLIAQPGRAYDRPGSYERVSVASDGSEGSGPSGVTSPSCLLLDAPAISTNGRYVAFASVADNLDPRDRNGKGSDVFRHDRLTKRTEIVSLDVLGTVPRLVDLPQGGICGPEGSSDPAISSSGRFVAFTSGSPALVPGDTNQVTDVFVRDVRAGTTEVVSVSSDGAWGNAPSFNPAISGDGRYVVFESIASNLDELSGCEIPLLVVSLQENCSRQVYLHDRKDGSTELVSVGSDGQVANYDSGNASISPNGRFVVFSTHATNLVPNDDGVCPLAPRRNCRDVYLRDLKMGKTELISVSVSGGSGNGDSLALSAGLPIVSSDGRYVAFESAASNLVPNDRDTDNAADVFVRDRRRHRTEAVSVTSSGVGVGAGGVQPSISSSGRFVAFLGRMSDEGYPEACEERCAGIMVHDRVTGATEGFSLRSGTQSYDSHLPSIDGSGRFVTFISESPTLVSGDNNGAWDVFVRDRGEPLGLGGFGRPRRPARLLLEVPTGRLAGQAATLDDARGDVGGPFRAVADITRLRVAYRADMADVWFDLELARLPETPELAGATAGVVYGVRFRLGSRPYEVRVASAGLGPMGETRAVFTLYSCEGGSCIAVANLEGGFGTTGARLTMSVPLEDLGVPQGARLWDVAAFSAMGTHVLGAMRLLDTAAPR